MPTVFPPRLTELYRLRTQVDREIRMFEAAYAVDERDSLAHTVAGAFVMDPADLTSRKQDLRTVGARRVLILMLRRRGLSYPEIGVYLGGRHHTTIMYAEQTATDEDHALARRLERRRAA